MWGGPEVDEIHGLVDVLTDPAAHLLRDGRLVVASADSWHLYSTVDRRLHRLGSSGRPPDQPPAGPIALLPTAQPDHVAVCPGRGPLTIYRID